MNAIEMNQISGKQFIEKLAKAIADNMQISQTKEEDKSNEQAAVSAPAVQQNCNRCGYRLHQYRNDCPAMGQTCRFCEKPNHFAAVCLKKLGRKYVNTTRDNEPTLKVDTEVVVRDGETKQWNIKGKLNRIGTFGQYGILKTDGSFLWVYPWFVRDANVQVDDGDLEHGTEVQVRDRQTKQYNRGLLRRIDYVTQKCKIEWADGKSTWENRKFVKNVDAKTNDSEPGEEAVYQ